MKALKHSACLIVMLAMCVFMVACPEPANNLGGGGNEFEILLGLPLVKGATDRSTINDDADVIKVYAKVYDSLGNHVPAVDNTGSDIPGVTKLAKSGSSWSATVNLVDPVSGTITFEIWAVAASGIHLYEGESSHVVGTNGNSVTVTTQAVYTVGSPGPAGGLIFYDKGSYSSGWRFLEAAPYGWSGGPLDPQYIFGYSGGTGVVGTSSSIGTGETNTTALVDAMGSAAYTTYNKTTTTGNYAAKICADYSCTVGDTSYDDWFLPSKDELDLMYDNLKARSIGGFSDGGYWSSSESSAGGAWGQIFISGSQLNNGRFNDDGVKPARAF